jgi:hypothetical protein
VEILSSYILLGVIIIVNSWGFSGAILEINRRGNLLVWLARNIISNENSVPTAMVGSLAGPYEYRG